jgi:hypothetical protein
MLHAGFLFSLVFDLEDGGDMFLRKCSGLHGVISQKIEPFVSTAVRTSHPIETHSCKKEKKKR